MKPVPGGKVAAGHAEGVRERNRQPVGVDRADVRRVPGLRRAAAPFIGPFTAQVTAEPFDAHPPPRSDGVRLCGEAVVVEHVLRRFVAGEVGVPGEALLVHERGLHHLRQQLQMRGVVVPEGRWVAEEVLDQRQALEKVGSAAGRRGHADSPTAVGRVQRVGHPDAEVREVGAAQQAAVADHGVGDHPGQLTGGQGVRVGGEHGQRIAEVGVDNTVTETLWAAVRREVKAGAVGGLGQLLDEIHSPVAAFVLGEHGRDVRPDDPTAARDLDRRRHQVGPRQAAVRGVQVRQQPRRAGHERSGGTRLVRKVAHDEAEPVAGRAEQVGLPHVGGGSGGHPAQPVVDRRRHPDTGQLREPEAAEAAHQRVDDPLHMGRGHARVHGVAAGAQHLRPDGDGLRLRRDDHGGRLAQAALGSGHGSQPTNTPQPPLHCCSPTP